MTKYRPWGRLAKLLPRLNARQWGFLGALSSEERSLGAWEQVHLLRPDVVQFVRVHGPDSHFRGATEQRLAERLTQFRASGGQVDWVIDRELLATHDEIVDLADQFIAASPPHVILDISSLPKRFFFPILKRLLHSQRVETLLTTYTIPSTYPPEALSENPQPADSLPLFAGQFPAPPVRSLIVGVGFQPLGLAEMLEGSGAEAVHVLFPYSANPLYLQRIWNFVRRVQTDVGPALRPPRFVPPNDASEVFDFILGMTGGGVDYTKLAPYGPKPMSLAMALAAAAGEWPVYYTQPTAYHPEYCIGIERENGMAVSYAYLIRARGQDLYTAPA